MDDALALAAAQLQKARTELDVAKAQYQGAETAFQRAKVIYEALETSLTAGARPDPPQRSLCLNCQAIQIASIFKASQSTSKSYRRNVGDLFHAVETQSSCVFCKFLIEAFQIGDESRSERLHAQLKPRDTAIYFASDPDGKAWYTKAGIDTSLSPCPFAWLQTGPPTITGQPHICISFESAFQNDASVGISSVKAFPRQRQALEAFNGSVNYTIVKSWLQKCRREHGAECQVDDTVSVLALDIYLINVKTRHLVRRRPGDRFVALSYVWGKGSLGSEPISIPNRDAVSKNEGGDRTDPNFVQELPVTIPQTMEDAILFVNHIGERFLWIDQLCIDQTEGEQKQKQINIMDQIFSSAYLTLVNLDGPNADWGLPGVSRPLLQTQQPTVRLDQGQLMATFIYSNWDNNGSSIWDSRGWTLQERLLSRRCVFFAKTYISMACRTEYFHDCLATSNPASKGIKTWLGDDYFREDGSGINLDDAEWDFKNYDALVSVFTGRNLTYQLDVLNACRGSLNRLKDKSGVVFAYGLPMSDCLRALIWAPHHAYVLARRLSFPSWSWAGWTGRIEYHYWVGDMAAYVDQGPQQVFTQSSTLKRKRSQHQETNIPYLEQAVALKFPSEERQMSSLTLETTTTKFKLRLVRRDGEPHRNLKPTSQQAQTAIGDHWRLIGGDGIPLRDHAGEYPQFKKVDYFFRIKPEYSEILLMQGNEADLVFIERWPCIRDSEASNKWLYDMVSALVIVRNLDGTAWRLASVLLKAEEWYARDPLPETICLV